MGIKKKGISKTKASKTLSSNFLVRNKKILKPSEVSFLHLINTDTKKEKQLMKSSKFLSKFTEDNIKKNPDPNLNQAVDSNLIGISKSSLRRRKRKLRENLKPKLSDLLDSLNSIEDDNNSAKQPNKINKNSNNIQNVKIEKKGYINKQLNKNQPNPHKSLNSFKIISKMENSNFIKVLNDESFKANPFQAIRDKINLQNSLML
ncbi:Slx9p ASCRUDRAFT_68097 [Ascoidea rubescens DSM 1968]|uniref:Ribosome biogenesis protein SLX9 n=1 Tax=Ascoidea rubescens DSM 1968 TaxID=1344418 RepID=A0A1D2VR39_9ASCO|nr:hypothetical protein ASCRUDRAFT_68097 [Ascoidea rubescens DSM 1968]ODV64071.1 hypothetical protein ASCRUDRAFT_68097 [Ascoidea rubescens DSM 1968]